MSRSSYNNALALDRYAKIMGINPISFSGAVLTGIDTPLIPVQKSCDEVWTQYSWQNNDKVSREDLALQISMAESELRDYTGYYLAPTWIEDEIHDLSENVNKNFYVTNPDIRFRVKYVNIIDIGKKKRELIKRVSVNDSTLKYIDKDGDSFKETAVIKINDIGTTNRKGIIVSYAGKMDDDTYDIKYPKFIDIHDNTLTIEIDSWLLIDYNLWEEYPSKNGEIAIDLTNNDKFVQELDVVRESVDYSVPAVTFCWNEDGVITEQSGWADIKSSEFVKIYPVYLQEGKIYKSNFIIPRVPDFFKLNYRSGVYANRWISGKFSDGLTDELALCITWLATARLEREFCQCGNATQFADQLREDVSASGQGKTSYFLPIDKIENPFGTRRGEMMAWMRISKYGRRKRNNTGAVI